MARRSERNDARRPSHDGSSDGLAIAARDDADADRAGERRDLPEKRYKLLDTNRLEAFSDGILTITITLLVFQLTLPPHAPGQLLPTLLGQWPTYIAFLGSFLYVGVIWLNHKSVFARVRRADRALHVANLFVLLTTALIPFPTVVLAATLQEDNVVDQQTAVALYAIIAGFMTVSWLVLFHYLHSRSHLLEPDVDPAFFRAERLRAWVGITSYAVTGVVGWAFAPWTALAVFVGLPIFYGLTSQGLEEALPRRAGRSPAS